jgi:hypothetical protein
MVHQALGRSVTVWKRIESEESDDSGHVVDLRRCGVALLPVNDRHRVAADNFRDILLPPPEVESTLADHLADRLWIGRVAGLFYKIVSMGATNPVSCYPAKRQ